MMLQKNLVEKFNEEGLPTGKVAAIFSGGDLAFSNKDCWNHLRNVRRKNFNVGDAQAVFNYCKQKQGQNSDFLYAIQCDDDARMKSFFSEMLSLLIPRVRPTSTTCHLPHSLD